MKTEKSKTTPSPGQLLAAMARGKPKHFSKAERKRRSDWMKKVTEIRLEKQNKNKKKSKSKRFAKVEEV